MSGIGRPALLFDWPLLMCEVLCLAAPFFALGICARLDAPDAVRARACIVVRVAALAAVLWALPSLLHDAAQIAGVPIADAVSILPAVIAHTHTGKLWIVRLGLYAAMAAAAWTPRARGLAAVGLIAAALLLVRAMGSHAIDHGAVAVASYWAHEMAASAWFGALTGLGLGLRGIESASVARAIESAAPRVSRTALSSVVMLLVTGAYAAWYSLGLELGNLVYSAFGRTLMLKLALVSGAILIGGYNRWFLLGRVADRKTGDELVRNVTAESMVLVAVLAISSVLAATPPAH